MKKTWLAWILIIIVVAAGIWFFYARANSSVDGASTAAGINGATDQGNGIANSQIIGDNLALGTDSTAALGTYLIGYSGMTVYTYTPDTGATSTCYDTCATNWPPYIVSPTDNIHQLQMGVTGAVGTTTRTDGQIQLTYNGHPLYFYSGDTTGEDTRGNGLGGVWLVVKA